MILQLSRENAVDFQNAMPEDKLYHLSHRLNIISPNVTQDSVDELCIPLGNIMIDAAKAAGAYKDCKKAIGKESGKKHRQGMYWKRKEYFKMKNLLKRKCTEAACNKKAKELKKFMKVKETRQI